MFTELPAPIILRREQVQQHVWNWAQCGEQNGAAIATKMCTPVLCPILALWVSNLIFPQQGTTMPA